MHLAASITAVVTGGASGLGATTARRLASHGVKVALFDLNAELGERVASDIGGVFCKVDVTSDAEVDAGFSRSRGLIGQERILINCAGIGVAKPVPMPINCEARGEAPMLAAVCAAAVEIAPPTCCAPTLGMLAAIARPAVVSSAPPGCANR